MGEADAVFCSLFRTDAEAALLACDEAGLLPEELLYLPKDIFSVGASLTEQGMIRYNMRERFRQEMFRKVFGLKRSLMLKGQEYVQQKWADRYEMFPDAAPIPDLQRIPRKKRSVATFEARVQSDEDEAFDTESEDDGLDEYFRPKPPAPTPPQRVSPVAQSLVPAPPPSTGWSGSNSLSVGSNRGGGPRSGGSSRRNVQEPPPPPKPPVPQLPKEPPRCRALTAKQLHREERFLEVSRRRLARYGGKVEKAVGMIKEREADRLPSASPSRPHQHSGTLACITPSSHLDGSVLSSSLPRIPLAHLEAKRQLAAVVRRTMVGIAESAIGYTAFRDVIDEQQEEEEENRSTRRAQSRSQARGARDVWAAQSEARRKRQEEETMAQRRLAQEYEAFSAQKAEKTLQVLQKRKDGHLLLNEVQRMRQMFAQEKRNCMQRREESRVTTIVARSEPKHQHAANVALQRQAVAEQRRLQHVQLELLRKELKNSVVDMDTRNEWEVPPLLEQLMASRSSTRQSMEDSRQL